MSEGAAQGQIGTKRRFAAFISYAHADADIAAKLQSRLERYRLPKHIALTHAEGDAALGKIFRDREDLAAAPSLSEAIRAAIAEAEALIVIASPDARASRWVGEEIALFRQLHPKGPILAVLVRGAPEEAFPVALTANGTEPLAADLRAEGDGEALGFLKIVAGIAGVPLDALVQRDAQRRLRRVTAITVGALAAMLIMGIMTAFAIQSRNEAARQRAEAEGLVEYMLTDLRGTLRGVGRPELMNDVNERAMAYYKEQGAIDALPPDSLERRARVLHAMGEDYDNMNQPDWARISFTEAHRTTALLLEQEPDNPERIFAHAQSEYWMGLAAWRKRDRATTMRYWQGYLAQAQRLLAVDKDKARANLEVGYAFGNLCDIFQYQSYDLPKSIQHCKKSIAFETRAASLAPANVEIQTALANRYGWLADTLKAQKSYRDAIDARENERRLIDRLANADPDNFQLQFRRLWPDIGIAKILIERGDVHQGTASLSILIGKLAALSAAAPDNAEVKRAWLNALYRQTRALSAINGKMAASSLADTKSLLEQMTRTKAQQQSFASYIKAMPELEEQVQQGGQ